MRIEHVLGSDQLIAHVTLQELDEIYETMMSAIKWRHANNEELTRKIVKDIIDAVVYSKDYKFKA
jgi:hypothetical protein